MPNKIIYILFIFSFSFHFSCHIIKVTSEEVVRAYIERIKEVNPLLNAVVEDRFEAAIEDAKRADKLVQTTPTFHLITNYPILGVPFTVKESCSLKGKYLYPKQKKHNNNNTYIYSRMSALVSEMNIVQQPKIITQWSLPVGQSVNPNRIHSNWTKWIKLNAANSRSCVRIVSHNGAVAMRLTCEILTLINWFFTKRFFARHEACLSIQAHTRAEFTVLYG